ncbi:hypothetical protein Tco_1570591 [Tanacetum coccineum]
MMLESQKWAGYQVTLSTLESKVDSLEAKKARLKAVETSLRREVEELKEDKRDVMSKVVPYVAMELVHSDELGKLVGTLVSSAITYGRCRAYEQVAAMKEPFDLSKAKGYCSSYKKEHTQASNDFATAMFPWLDEFVADAATPIEALLSKKPPTLQKPAPSRTQMPKSAFQWLEQATLTFKELEQAMVQSPVLALPNFEEEFIIKTNASGYEVGAILQQRGHPIAYLISAAGTKVTTVGVESLRPDWYNKVTTAERIKTAQEKIKIAYVIYVGVYSASSLVGKGQPHIVHGKPEQGGSVAPLLARDTKTESEDLLHKEVVKIRNVWDGTRTQLDQLWKWSVCCGGSAEKLIRQLGVSSGSVPFDMGIKVRLVDSRMWCVMSAGFKTDDGKECGVRMLLHQKKKRQKASSKLVVVRSEKTRNVLLVWNERDMRLQNGPAWSKRPQLPLKKNDENTTTTTLATSKLVGLAKKLPATQYNISLTLSLQEMMFRLRGGYFARENKIGKSPEEVAAREK